MGAEAPIFSIRKEKEMIYEPRQNNRVPDVCVLCLLICAGVAYAFSIIDSLPGRGMLQAVSLCLFCAVIFIAVRYKFTSFRYTISVDHSGRRSRHHADDEETVTAGGMSCEEAERLPIRSVDPSLLVLRIERRQGRGPWGTECIIGLSEITSCCLLPEEEERFEKMEAEFKGGARYKYFKNMAAEKKTVITADTKSGKVMVWLERDANISPFLHELCK